MRGQGISDRNGLFSKSVLRTLKKALKEQGNPCILGGDRGKHNKDHAEHTVHGQTLHKLHKGQIYEAVLFQHDPTNTQELSSRHEIEISPAKGQNMFNAP